MASLTSRSVSFKQASSAVAPKRTRVVKAMAVANTKQGNFASAFTAVAAAAVLLVSSPAPSLAALNPQAQLATDPVTKVLKKLDAQTPPKGVPGPEVEGQFRANPVKARELALENSPAGSPEAENAARKSFPRRRM